MTSFGEFGVLVQIAFRNLFAHRLKTFIVGGIVFFGAVLVVVGGSLVGSMTEAMSRSIIGSAAGHIQVYSAKSRDELALWGSFSEPDLSEIDDYAKMKQAIDKVPNVKTVVPMGINGALITSGNTIDVVLAKLRKAIQVQREAVASDGRSEPGGGASPPGLGAPGGGGGRVPLTDIDALKNHVRQIISVLALDRARLVKALSEQHTADPRDAEALDRTSQESFWNDFDRDPFAALEYLENRIAPQAADSDLLYLRYVGTDPAAFNRTFDRIQIVDGTPIADGHRGFLFSKVFYEDHLKLRTAHRLDQIKEAIEEKHTTIAQADDLKQMVKQNTEQLRELLLQLDGRQASAMGDKLRAELKSTETDLGKLLAQFLAMDDANFAHRYDFFYAQLAPMLELYRIRVGDTLTIKAFTRTGYIRSTNVKVYGTFQFKGLEKSQLAGGLNVMDLVSFRQLYGALSADTIAEVQKMKASMNAKEVDRGNAEAELFGDASTVTAPEPTQAQVDESGASDGRSEPGRGGSPASLGGGGGRVPLSDTDRIYGADEMQHGMVLNAAVMVNDPKKIAETAKAIEAAGTQAGLSLKAISWQDAAGILGKMATMFRLVLMVAVMIIFVVALVIINNSMVMATLERVQEIGTLRAIGAQRRFVLTMLLVEALVIGAVFGGLGAGVGSLIVNFLGRVGIPAKTQQLYFFFSGPRLMPTLAIANVIAAMAIVLVVSVFSGLYPAWLAMRITPRQAMASEE